ncbi:hypothetical protein Vadar_004360 [Vaccinium darrowii]|uniref:Uncharacterized protein n=1 Tax=Vaccinium darrowii TaxID=229202 RepID=A0ACB7X844_9ERIC|nr:hypothetical protein Vadar_004360 [Vaccinium darrowii]
MESSFPGDGEGTPSRASEHKRGGWITFPFMLATVACMTLGIGGWTNNLIVYMIEEFNVESIDAVQIWNIVNGSTIMFTLLGAIIADSFLGNFAVLWISSVISFLGIILLLLGSTIDTMRPPPCVVTSPSTKCITASKLQFAGLYVGMGLASVAGAQRVISPLGADQFDKPKHQVTFFNWIIFSMYVAYCVTATVIIYVENDVSWGLGFGLSAGATVVGLAILFSGCRFYRYVKPKGSPFLGLARVVVAAIRKRNVSVPIRSEDYYRGADDRGTIAATTLTGFKCLNRAAVKAEGDTKPDGSIAKPWKLCTMRQVEDLKIVIRLVPLWSTGILLSTPLAIQASLFVLQALTMDRRLGPHFTVPAASMLIFLLIFTPLTIIFLDRLLYPAWQKLTGRFPPPLQRVGIGHVVVALSMVVSALVESKRLKEARKHRSMSVFWLVPQLALIGIGEGFQLPGNSTLFYQEFPAELKSTGTALVSLFVGLAYYVSVLLVSVVRRSTRWLPNDINDGRMDNLYWLVFGLAAVNFVFYLVCAWLYKYRGLARVAAENY